MTKPSNFYREKAVEMRELAKRATDSSNRNKFNEIADEYERLGRNSTE